MTHLTNDKPPLVGPSIEDANAAFHRIMIGQGKPDDQHKVLTLPSVADKFREFLSKHPPEKPYRVFAPIGSDTGYGNEIGVITVEELQSTNEPDLEWIVDGLLFRGGFSLLTGRPKSGKSTLGRCLAAALANGDQFLGRETVQCSTLYVALEEHRAGLKAEWTRLGVKTHGRVKLFIGMPENMALFSRLLAEAVKLHQPDLVIVDHLGHAARADDLNDYAKVRNALEPYRQLARLSGAHVMLLHHSKKQGGSFGGEALGSTAITGLVDTAMMIGIASERREIYSINRHGDALDKTLLDFDADRGAMDAGVTVEQHMDRGREQEIIDFLGDQREGMDKSTVAKELAMSPNKALKLLRQLINRGLVTITGTGNRGDPILYRVSDPIGDEYTIQKTQTAA